MGKCRDLESQLTAYVDGDVGSDDRAIVESHLERCPPCRGRVISERVTHELIASHRQGLRGSAPDALKHRCAAQRFAAASRNRLFDRRLIVPLAVAATLVVAAALLVMLGWGSGVETYAAQLADDHVQCFQAPPVAVTADAVLLGRTWQSANGWPLKVAASSSSEDLQLLTVRRCGSSRGEVAHLMYRWHGEPLSVYVLNDTIQDADSARRELSAHEVVTKEGEQAIIWTAKGRTYAVVGRGRAVDLEHIAGYVRTTIE